MESPNFSRSQALNNIPTKKVQDYLDAINNSNEDDKTKHIRLIAANRYAESNIPVEYWSLKMDKDFHGDPRLLEKYNRYVADLKSAYTQGTSLCLAGNHGLGKTMTMTCILKKASQKGYSCLYTTLSDIVTVLTNSSSEDKYLARKELVMVDFLVIDEFDSRFMPSDNAADLYARSLESVFRTRSQNKLPTLMCTNSPNVVESFNGSLKQSIHSLMKGYIKMFPVFGEDFRNFDWMKYVINFLDKYEENLYEKPLKNLTTRVAHGAGIRQHIQGANIKGVISILEHLEKVGTLKKECDEEISRLISLLRRFDK